MTPTPLPAQNPNPPPCGPDPLLDGSWWDNLTNPQVPQGPIQLCDPTQAPTPLETVGGEMGREVQSFMTSKFDELMLKIWEAGLWLMRNTFTLVDYASVFTVDPAAPPLASLWPLMLSISGVLALGLFFHQLTMTVLRGGVGFYRLALGPIQYGLALAATAGIAGVMLAAADGISSGILQVGLHENNFHDVMNGNNGRVILGSDDDISDASKSVILGLLALFGVFPASLALGLEMVFRAAVIYLLIATLPITAAGLLAGVTYRWFWTAVRVFLAAAAMKPLLSLTLVLGVNLAANAQGLIGTLAGVAILIIAVICPLLLFKLFTFVDPNTDAGAGFRNAASSIGLPTTASPAVGGSAGGGGGGGAQEQATESRFVHAASAPEGSAQSGAADERVQQGQRDDDAQRQALRDSGDDGPPDDSDSGGGRPPQPPPPEDPPPPDDAAAAEDPAVGR